MFSFLIGYSSKMRRGWPRHIFVTPQGTGLILPCLALLPPRVFSTKLNSKLVMVSKSVYLRHYVFMCVGVCVL